MSELQKALSGNTESIYNALFIKKYRQSLYPNNNEEQYELNEGTVEYTGVKLSNPNPNSYIIKKLNYNINNGYTNGFAYGTGAAYALLLDSLYPQAVRQRLIEGNDVFV